MMMMMMMTMMTVLIDVRLSGWQIVDNEYRQRASSSARAQFNQSSSVHRLCTAVRCRTVHLRCIINIIIITTTVTTIINTCVVLYTCVAETPSKRIKTTTHLQVGQLEEFAYSRDISNSSRLFLPRDAYA